MELQLVRAPLILRFVNCLVDTFVVMIVDSLFQSMIVRFLYAIQSDLIFIFLRGSLSLWIYRIFSSMIFTVLIYWTLEGATNGKTFGKLITGTIVVKKDGNDITWKDAFIRSIARLIPFEPLSVFMPEFWHDRLADTMVIKKQPDNNSITKTSR